MYKQEFINALEILEKSPHIESFALIGKLGLIPQVPNITPTLDIDFLADINSPELFEKDLKRIGFCTGKIELPEGGYLIRFWREEAKIPIDIFKATKNWQKRIIKDALNISFLGKLLPIARKEGILALKIAYYRDFKDREAVKLLLEDTKIDYSYLMSLLKEADILSRFKFLIQELGVQPVWEKEEEDKT